MRYCDTDRLNGRDCTNTLDEHVEARGILLYEADPKQIKDPEPEYEDFSQAVR
jgi:hypothetical protein